MLALISAGGNSMTTIRLIVQVGLALVILGAPVATQGQEAAKVFRVGVLFQQGPLPAMAGREPSHPHLRAFLGRLRELGYVEGQNLVVERRAAEGQRERLPVLAAELVALKVDVILAGPLEPPRAAKQATRTIPIVAPVMDPAEPGLVESLARPGGNLTGLRTAVDWQIDGKRLQILKEVAPGISRVAVLHQTPPTVRSFSAASGELESAARVLGVTLHPVGVERPEQLEGAFAAMTQQRADAVYVLENPLSWAHRRAIAAYAAKARLPAIYGLREYAEAGGLMAYGVNILDLFRRAADYVDRVLKGAKPADLPVEQPTKFELVINLRTSKALGLMIPQSVLALADEVIDQ
jgi:putative tryptophan/tyrosine transport system substrate-binding protein